MGLAAIHPETAGACPSGRRRVAGGGGWRGRWRGRGARNGGEGGGEGRERPDPPAAAPRRRGAPPHRGATGRVRRSRERPASAHTPARPETTAPPSELTSSLLQ